jgi:hypothetical protein
MGGRGQNFNCPNFSVYPTLGCQENLGVRKIRVSGKSGCQENLDVRKIWVSGKSGCQENLKGDLYTPDARPALLATPWLASLAAPCTPRWRRPAHKPKQTISTE